MATKPCPGCGLPLDLASINGYSALRQMSGKFCPGCGHPLDESAAVAEKSSLNYGADTAKIHETRLGNAKEFAKVK